MRAQRVVGDALADQPDLGQLDRLLGACTMAVGALVLLAEGFLELGERAAIERAVRDRHRQVEGLALVVQAGEAADLNRARREAVGGELEPRLALELVARPHRAHRGRCVRRSRRKVRA